MDEGLLLGLRCSEDPSSQTKVGIFAVIVRNMRSREGFLDQKFYKVQLIHSLSHLSSSIYL